MGNASGDEMGNASGDKMGRSCDDVGECKRSEVARGKGVGMPCTVVGVRRRPCVKQSASDLSLYIESRGGGLVSTQSASDLPYHTLLLRKRKKL